MIILIYINNSLNLVHLSPLGALTKQPSLISPLIIKAQTTLDLSLNI